MKIKLFSHIDLDGFGCNIVLQRTYGTFNEISKEDVTNVNYDKINEVVLEFIQSEKYKEYTHVFITDISVSEEVAIIIDSINKTTNTEFVLLDHHPTALFLNKYDWATVQIESDIGKVCGTYLFYNYLINNNFVEAYYSYPLDDLVENIRRYDTWEWSTRYNDKQPKKLNDLFYLIGKEDFLDELYYGLDYVSELLEKYKLLLDNNDRKIQEYIKRKNKLIIPKTIQGFNVGVVFAEQYSSELGNELSILNPQYDLIAIISDGSVSLRTVKEGVDCGAFAKLYGGGGHFKASGMRINDESKVSYINNIFGL